MKENVGDEGGSTEAPVPGLTPAQRRGAQTVGTNVLVSAAAGSGKTTMLSERCAYLVCDAPPPYRCDVDELLVVTFTEKAAAEMKDRIGKAIRRRIATSFGGPGERLREQERLIDQAQVSTLHSFCSRLLRQNFHLVGLDPGFAVMDGEEAKLLRLEVGRQLMGEHFDRDDDGSFHRLVDAYADGDDERLLRHIIQLHELLASVVDPAAWLERANNRLVEAAAAPGKKSELGAELLDLLGRRLAALKERCAGARKLVAGLGGFPVYEKVLHELLQAVGHWEKVLETEGIDTLAEEMKAIELDRLPSVKSDVPNKDVAKAAVDAVRKEVKAGGWREILRFTTEQWRDGMKLVVPHAHRLLSLLEQFGNDYQAAKEETRQVDFADLERYTLKVLRDDRRQGLYPSPTARVYHRLFKHVLVDEYQDINELQDAILGLLSHDCLEKPEEGGGRKEEGRRKKARTGAPAGSTSGLAAHPSSFIPPSFSFIYNLFCVGDVKQSIYRFRLAEPERFQLREKEYRHPSQAARGAVIDLQANFRSRAPLLAALNSVFERLMTLEAAEIQYDDTHRLVAGKSFPDGDGRACFVGSPIEMHLLPARFGGGGEDGGSNTGGDRGGSSGQGADAEPGCSGDAGQPQGPGEDFDLDRTEREAVLIARRIHELVGSGGNAPAHVIGTDDTCRPIRFRDVVILLRSMRYKADQYAEVLRASGVPVHTESGTGYFESTEIRDMLALLAVLDNQRQDIPLAAVLRSPLGGLPAPEDDLARIRLAYGSRQQPIPFHQAVVRYAAEKEDGLAARLRGFLHELDGWRETAHRRPLAETIWSIFEQTGYLAYVTGLTGGAQRAANLLYLHERATQFGTFHRQGLGRFMEFMDQLQAESDLGQPSVASEAEDVVRIMSIHRSKGLEFPVVVLPDLGKGINLTDCQGPILMDRQAGLGMVVADEAKQARYPSLASTLVQERLRRKAIAEEIRVLYVAMTRAKEHLILVGTCGEDLPERWRARWAHHSGPLPTDPIVGGRCLLDWLGPVAACAPGVGGPIFHVTPHGSAEVAGWSVPTRGRPERTPRQDRIARLEPLDPAPPQHADAQAAIDRLSFRYKYEALAGQAATRSVTGAKAGGNSAVMDDQSAGVPASPDISAGEPRSLPGPSSDHSIALPLPHFLAVATLSAADVGTATHLVLEHLDFSRPLDADDIDAQLASMVSRRLIEQTLAEAVDRSAIVWFAQTEAGKLMRDNAARMLRELPVYFAASLDADGGPASHDDADRVMVRGRLDVVIPPLAGEAAGATIVDFKTDAVAGVTVPVRAQRYSGQVQQYREAIERITGRPAARVYLVFLSPRVVWET